MTDDMFILCIIVKSVLITEQNGNSKFAVVVKSGLQMLQFFSIRGGSKKKRNVQM